MSKPFECWAVVDRLGEAACCLSEETARDTAELWGETAPEEGPHRVVLLREVVSPKKGKGKK